MEAGGRPEHPAWDRREAQRLGCRSLCFPEHTVASEWAQAMDRQALKQIGWGDLPLESPPKNPPALLGLSSSGRVGE